MLILCVISELHEGLVTFERRALTRGSEVNWEQSQTTFTNLHVKSSGSIEKTDGAGMLQVLVLIILIVLQVRVLIILNIKDKEYRSCIAVNGTLFQSYGVSLAI